MIPLKIRPLQCFATYVLLSTFFIHSLSASSTETVYLSGTGADDTVDWDFKISGGRKSGEWTTIPVPSNWELQGFGTYNYGHDLWEERGYEIGYYKHTFMADDSWEGERVEIVFEGSMTDTEVKINGEVAGPIQQGSFYQFSYDISEFLKYGEENLLEVKVSKHSANDSVNWAERKADYWIFGGIFRPVYLEIKPKTSIDWTAIDAKANGDFEIHVYLNETTDADKITAQIQTLDGQNVSGAFETTIDSTKVTLTTQIDTPRTWNPESPNLYNVVLELQNGNDTIHKKTERFGFRTIEVRKRDGIYVNGQKIRFKGVNRHSFHPDSGRTTSNAMSIEDVKLIKGMNMNAVRMSHYPPDKHFLETCDELGLFVINELAGWQAPWYYTEVGEILVRQMVQRDVNHPSIILWSNGNEGGSNDELDDDFHLYDPQKRSVMHSWRVWNGLDAQHYKSVNYGIRTFFSGRDIFFPTEFLHGLYDGGHGAGLEDYWGRMVDNPLSAGGFLWVFSDEAVKRTDLGNILDTDGNHAPDGIVGPYREKEGSYYAIKDIWSPVIIKQRSITSEFSGELRVENEFYFTDLAECTFEWELVNFPNPDSAETGYTVMHSGTSSTSSIPAQTIGILNLGLPENFTDYHALYLKAYDPQGQMTTQWSWALQSPETLTSSLISSPASGKFEISNNERNLFVRVNDIQYAFDTRNGILASVTNNEGTPFMLRGPLLEHQEFEFKSLSHSEIDGTYVVRMAYEKGFDFTEWTIFADGTIKLECSYMNRGTFDSMGINFHFPEETVTGAKMLANGPYRVWKNRMKGPKLGVWDKPYNDTITGQTWDYPEFKGFYSEFYWAEIQSDLHPFKVYTSTEDLFLRLFTPGTPDFDPRYTQVEFPKADISFLHAIPPIGTKFMPADRFGFQGQGNQFSGAPSKTEPFNIELYFDFSVEE